MQVQHLACHEKLQAEASACMLQTSQLAHDDGQQQKPISNSMAQTFKYFSRKPISVWMHLAIMACAGNQKHCKSTSANSDQMSQSFQVLRHTTTSCRHLASHGPAECQRLADQSQNGGDHSTMGAPT
jgi:hypothetical protein